MARRKRKVRAKQRPSARTELRALTSFESNLEHERSVLHARSHFRPNDVLHFTEHDFDWFQLAVENNLGFLSAIAAQRDGAALLLVRNNRKRREMEIEASHNQMRARMSAFASRKCLLAAPQMASPAALPAAVAARGWLAGRCCGEHWAHLGLARRQDDVRILMRHDGCSGWVSVRVRVRAVGFQGSSRGEARAAEERGEQNRRRQRAQERSACGSKQRANERQWEVSDRPTNDRPASPPLPLPLLLWLGSAAAFGAPFLDIDACGTRISRLLTKMRTKMHQARPICAMGMRNACGKLGHDRFHVYAGLDRANRAQQPKKREKNRLISIIDKNSCWACLVNHDAAARPRQPLYLSTTRTQPTHMHLS
jgi:hypothetical protein